MGASEPSRAREKVALNAAANDRAQPGRDPFTRVPHSFALIDKPSF